MSLGLDVFSPPSLSWILSLPKDDEAALKFIRGYSGRGFYPKPGVYFLWYDLNLVYIGKSDRSVSSRIDNHHRERKKEFQEASAFYAQTQSEAEAIGGLEADLIDRFYPKYNAPYPHTECHFCDRVLRGISFPLGQNASFCGLCMHDFQLFERLLEMGFISPEGEGTEHLNFWGFAMTQRLSERNSLLEKDFSSIP